MGGGVRSVEMTRSAFPTGDRRSEQRKHAGPYGIDTVLRSYMRPSSMPDGLAPRWLSHQLRQSSRKRSDVSRREQQACRVRSNHIRDRPASGSHARKAQSHCLEQGIGHALSVRWMDVDLGVA